MVTWISNWLKVLVVVVLWGGALTSVSCIENPDQFASSSDTSLDTGEPDADVGEPDADVGEPDADADGPDADADGPDADADGPEDTSITCDEPDADEFCTTYETVCGSLSVIDACGDFHQLDCGSCQDGVCLEGGCFPPGCDDGVQNQDETDIDCGGDVCPPCAGGKSCDDDTDCLSGVCIGDECAEPTCDDGVLNQGETDTDCGGPNCDPCPLGARCIVDSDCAQGVCLNEECTGHSTLGLQALYTFSEGEGGMVYDRSGLEPPLDLSFEGEDGTVEWGDGCNCIEFSGGALRHNYPSRLYGATFIPPGKFSVEMWINTEQTTQSGPARLVGLSSGTGARNLTIGHQDEGLEIRVRHDNHSGGSPYANFNDSIDDELTHLVVIFDEGVIQLYRDGQHFETDDQSRADTIWNWDWGYPLILGNETSMNRAWQGRMHFVAFYNRALSADEIDNHYQMGHEMEY